MLSVPELSKIILQFEDQFLTTQDPDNPKNFQNHESGKAAQKSFHCPVNNLFDVIRRIGNPFLDDFLELVTIDNRDCAEESVIESIRKLDRIGEEQYSKYVDEVIKKRIKLIKDPIRKTTFHSLKRISRKRLQSMAKRLLQLEQPTTVCPARATYNCLPSYMLLCKAETGT